MPAQELALTKSRATSMFAARLAGIAPAASLGVAAAAFAPAPVTVSAGVLELHGESDAPFDLADTVLGMDEDRDDGIGSASYFATKRMAALAAAVAEGRPSDAALVETRFRLRRPAGVALEETELVRAMPGGALVGMNPIAPEA